jgi:hypothetical protein
VSAQGAIAPEHRRAFVLGGCATFTLVGQHSRFTYRVERAPKAHGKFWVHVLRGPDTSRDFCFMGQITTDGFRVAFNGPIKADAPSARAFAWFWRHVESTDVELLHAGTCGRCGRMLTTPESIATGLGPVCAARVA